VSPQAMWRLRPAPIPGNPGSVIPATWKSGASSIASYQIDGLLYSRCGSKASNGLPVQDRFPDTAHELLNPDIGNIVDASSPCRINGPLYCSRIDGGASVIRPWNMASVHSSPMTLRHRS